MDDAELIAEYRLGNEDAFGQLLQRYLSPVYHFVFQLAGDRSAAEDIVQETFIKAWKHLARYDRSRSFKTWLFAIAKNTAYDFLKKKKSFPFSSFEDEEGNNILEESVSAETLLPDEMLERKDAADELEAVLREIPERYRSLLLLAYKEDFSLQEIADILGEPYNTIKSRHGRALKRLKQAFLERDASKGTPHSY